MKAEGVRFLVFIRRDCSLGGSGGGWVISGIYGQFTVSWDS